jgi:hypothetical protein
MMRLKVKQLGEGLHPSEMFVSVETKDGPQDLAVHPCSIQGSTLSGVGLWSAKATICS